MEIIIMGYIKLSFKALINKIPIVSDDVSEENWNQLTF